MPSDLGDIIVKAELAAMVCIGMDTAPLSRAQVTAIACLAVWQRAQLMADVLPPAELEMNLTLHAVRAIREAQAGMATDRERLTERIEHLPLLEQRVFALRYEHMLADWQIAQALGITEDEVVTLMLRALQAVRWGGPDDAGD